MFADERNAKTVLYRVAGTDVPMEFIPVPGVREGDLLVMVTTLQGPNVLVELWPGYGMPEGLRIRAEKSIPYRVRRPG